MYKEQMEIITEWESFLAKIEPNMCLELKTILGESINNKNIYALFFEYEFDYMDIVFYAIDEKENIVLKKVPILNNEINCKYLFPENLMEKQMETNDNYEGEDEHFDDFSEEYYEKKEEIFKNWFIGCWDKIRCEYNNIPGAYFSIHDTNYKINLETKKKVKYNEIISMD
jgi:hypothetical protein